MGYLLSLQTLQRADSEPVNAQFASTISASACISHISTIC